MGELIEVLKQLPPEIQIKQGYCGEGVAITLYNIGGDFDGAHIEIEEIDEDELDEGDLWD
ncbi:hypothetical protein [Kistimonas asteriae]|uniref:hypothetical protein n=1 Tax=Kistimonas asteriae TaxID=517724 RepID=UPI001BA76849|nr:hypothetical protein [Kistimonas asteriae]